MNTSCIPFHWWPGLKRVAALFLLALFPALAPGAVDDFNPNVTGSVWAIAVQPDGKVVLGGRFTAVGGLPRTNLARLQANGSVDGTFTAGADELVQCLALQTDGSILVGGQFTSIGGQPRGRIARLTPDGEVDAAFNPSADGAVEAILVQQDGQIVIGGEFHSLGGEFSEPLARLAENGTMDGDFGVSLQRIPPEIYSLALQPDGRILFGGDDYYARVNSNGTPDSTFVTQSDDPGIHDVFCLALQPNGRVLLGGDLVSVLGAPRRNIARVGVDGIVDAFFNPDASNATASFSAVLTLALQANGKIVVGGQFDILDGQPRTNLGRLFSNGALDPSFTAGTDGIVRSIVVQRDGSILVGGEFSTVDGVSRNGLARLQPGDELRITSASQSGELTLEGTFNDGVGVVEGASNVTGPWTPVKNTFTTSGVAQVSVVVTGANSFYRAQALDLSGGRAGFTNLTRAYGLLSTIAGAGGPQDVNNWRPEFEGGPATSAVLSGPHITMADRAGNYYIADKDAHGVRKVRRDGTIITVAGINIPGNGSDEPEPGTTVALSEPNGLWVRPDGTVYILDTGNGKVRRLDTNGVLRTLFTVPGGIIVGRGLWVSDDETLAYLCSLTVVKRWTPGTGVTDFSTGFTQLGNLVVEPAGTVVVTDRGSYQVYRLDGAGLRTTIAGSGSIFGGGDGQPALSTFLEEVRAVWRLPNGGFFVGTHRGSQVWYIDPEGIIHLLLHGHRGGAHTGDGTWFYNPTEPRVSEIRAVTLDHDGNLIITEHDAGYVRKVEFLPVQP